MARKKREARQAQPDRSELARVIAASQGMDEVQGIYEAFAPKPTELGDDRRASELQGAVLAHELRGEGVRAELPGDTASAYRANQVQ